MDIAKITNIHEEVVAVDIDTLKLRNYDNKSMTITYNAEIVENGVCTGFWTDFEAFGRVDHIEDRLETWNNPVKLAYAKAVGFNASENDPDKRLWTKVVEYVTKNQDKFFTKTGDWKKVVGLNIKNGQIEVRSRGGAREGAGRKPAEVKRDIWSVRVTDEERKALEKVLKDMRG